MDWIFNHFDKIMAGGFVMGCALVALKIALVIAIIAWLVNHI